MTAKNDKPKRGEGRCPHCDTIFTIMEPFVFYWCGKCGGHFRAVQHRKRVTFVKLEVTG